MRIDELFDKAVPVEWHLGPQGGTATFEAGGKNFEASWYLSDRDTELNNFAFYNKSVDPNKSTKVTGTGDQHTVISTIIEILKALMKKYPIKEITFVADEPNRRKLYSRIMKTVFPEWKGEEEFEGAFRYTKPDINLRETFNKPLPWRKKTDAKNIYYFFKTPEDKNGIVNIMIKSNNVAEIEFFIDFKQGVTAGGEAIPIFATVIDCVKNALRSPGMKDVWRIEYAAAKNDESRNKLYSRFARILPQAGYEFVGVRNEEHQNLFQFDNIKKKERQENTTQIEETFDRPLSWHKKIKGNFIYYYFVTPEGKKGVLTTRIGDRGIADIQFEIDQMIDTTKGGEAIPIFATVIDCVKDVLKDPMMDNVWGITFSADKRDESRNKLYSRFAKMLPQAGYNFVGTHDDGPYNAFQFVNPEKKKQFDARLQRKADPALQIGEAFDKPLPWHKKNKGNDIYYSFVTPEGKRGDITVIVNPRGVADIGFEIDGSMKITGGGEALPIFATVIDCVKNAVKDPAMDDVREITFSADKRDESRNKLYSRFARILPQAGYEFVGTRGNALYNIFAFVNPEKKKRFDASSS